MQHLRHLHQRPSRAKEETAAWTCRIVLTPFCWLQRRCVSWKLPVEFAPSRTRADVVDARAEAVGVFEGPKDRLAADGADAQD